MSNDTLLIRARSLCGADFSSRRLSQFSAVASSFEDCVFDRTTFKQACFGAGRAQSRYVRCSFNQARITAVVPGNARFEQSNFREVVLTDFFAHDVEMIDCVFSGTFKKGFLNGRPLEPAEIGRTENAFRGNDFRDMELLDVAFRTGIDLNRQILPSGAQYLYLQSPEAALSEARVEVLRWQDLEARRKALAILESLAIDVDGGQRQILYRADTSTKSMRKAAEAVADLLRRHAA